MDLDTLPDDALERLACYQRARDEERQRVEAALRKPASERTEHENRIVAYSPFGSGAKCGY